MTTTFQYSNSYVKLLMALRGFQGLSSCGDDADSLDTVDEGFGWFVVFTCWLMHTIYLGLQYSFAVLYPFLLDEFGQSRGTTALVQGVQIGIAP